MSIVTALRLNDNSGVIVSDEESWHLRNRRTFINDNIRPLLPPEISAKTGIVAAYGGVGNATVHLETVEKTHKKLKEAFAANPKAFSTTEEVCRVALGELTRACRRRVDDRLEYLYGFNSADLTRGHFMKDGEKYEIKQDAVKSRALKIATAKDKGPAANPVFNNDASIIACDPEYGFAMYTMKAADGVLSFVGGGFEALGKGKYGAGISFSKFFNRKTLAERKKGYAHVEGVVHAVDAANYGAAYFGEVGGYFQIVVVDGKGKTPQERYREVSHHPAKLTQEIVAAYRAGILARKAAYGLVERICFAGESWESVEADMFASAKSWEMLELFLRGYKVDPKAPLKIKAAPFLPVAKKRPRKKARK